MRLNMLRNIFGVVLAQVALLAVAPGAAVHASPGQATVEVAPGAVARTRLGLLLLPVTLRCTVPRNSTMQSVTLYISAQQTIGVGEAFGVAYPEDFICDGEAVTKVITVTPGTYGFAGGAAEVSVDAWACWWPPGESQSSCVNQSVQETIRVVGGGRIPPPTSGGTFPMAVAAAGRRLDRGSAMIRLQYSCYVPPGGRMFDGTIYVNVRQPRGRLSSAAASVEFRDLDCDGSIKRTNVAVMSTTGVAFRPGLATVDLFGSMGWVDEDWQEDYIDGFMYGAVVRLHRRG